MDSAGKFQALVAASRPGVEAPRPTKDPIAARTAAEEFEAVFLSQMLDGMFAGIETDGAFGGGFSEGIYRGMLNQQYAKLIAKQGGVGIADAVMREIMKTQEVG
ncbi:MAG: chemotaxis protein [Alphaproteobacteria bacterium]|nr:chemotaxis protein [Alphaproteobacteria bacterium]